MRIRDARAGEAAELTALVLRSKRSWGYDDAFMAACRAELTIAPGEVAARRIVVAEDTAGARDVLGVASLEGSAPEGRLGLLFVEPRANGRGVGSALYAHVLTTARGLGFTRLLIESDPHAVPFYRHLGARRCDGEGRALPLLGVSLAPAGWPEAWTGGRRTVHLGNAGEFQGQFGPLPKGVRGGADHYSCLAAFTGPHPAALVLPRTVPPFWIELVARRLAWGQVEVFDGLDEPDGTAAAVLRRPALAGHLRGLGLPLVAWGQTRAVAELTGGPWSPDVLRYESKRAANELFARLAPDHPGVRVPAQWPAATRRAAARLLGARLRSGAATVVKTEHGAGGSGTRVVTSGRARAALRTLPHGPLLLEEYLAGGGVPGDLTYDGFVDAAGEVHDVGAAVMDVRDAGYRGATVGPGVVPAELAGPCLRFGRAVGREVAATGYRGWFDVDFVTGPDGRPAPTEINLRLTGPAVAFMVQARLDAVRGGGHLVRTIDRVPLGARLPERELAAWLGELSARCAGVEALLVPSIPTAAFEPDPYVGVVLAARTRERLDAADALVGAAAAELGAMFTS
ncbi:GNAT family N-acetyltransferase [Streptomyces litchfieldiae]|uniref:GNAT family N-acetyltransferase n=1 Tax=Streptomyces litchfieldiae TaxID=3075543 RepID=A0ABU2MRK1_9ACTN|nr:GNAT family N-acetyltransferase [Streptomyces sp. DSM 44938]MDT0343523.1 GNAT family N-acetyltransferase [Streptomyces sp. DSM 44938]